MFIKKRNCLAARNQKENRQERRQMAAGREKWGASELLAYVPSTTVRR